MTRYRVIVADPPWAFSDRLRMSAVRRSAGDHYPTMTMAEICALAEWAPLRIAGHQIARDAFLWLWVPNAFILDGSGVNVCRWWGFEPRQLVTWVKGRIEDERFIAHVGLGHFTRGATEHLILATRGTAKALVKDRGVPNVILAPRTSHSTKPDAAYALVQRLCPGPYLELFARRTRATWTTWGDEVAA